MSSEETGDWVELKTYSVSSIETIRAHFEGHAYDPHWHDSYLIGVTEKGAQQFSYRRKKHTSIPGNTFLLEPGRFMMVKLPIEVDSPTRCPICPKGGCI